MTKKQVKHLKKVTLRLPSNNSKFDCFPFEKQVILFNKSIENNELNLWNHSVCTKHITRFKPTSGKIMFS